MAGTSGFVPYVAWIGQGSRRALALHCTMGFSGAWAGVERAMDGDVTLIAPEMPSHGLSADWDGRSDFAAIVLEAARAQLDRPMDVIGHSFGAVVALWLAVEYPGLVRSLTLYEPVLFHVALRDAPETVAAENAFATEFDAACAREDWAAAARIFSGFWSDRPSWHLIPRDRRAAMIRAAPVVPATSAFLYEDTAGLMPRLRQLEIPTLLLRGGASPPAIAAINDGLLARLPNAESRIVEPAGHMGPITHSARVAQLWSTLLARTG